MKQKKKQTHAILTIERSGRLIWLCVVFFECLSSDVSSWLAFTDTMCVCVCVFLSQIKEVNKTNSKTNHTQFDKNEYVIVVAIYNRNQVVSIDICILMSYIICQYSILKLFVLVPDRTLASNSFTTTVCVWLVWFVFFFCFCSVSVQLSAQPMSLSHCCVPVQLDFDSATTIKSLYLLSLFLFIRVW